MKLSNDKLRQIKLTIHITHPSLQVLQLVIKYCKKKRRIKAKNRVHYSLPSQGWIHEKAKLIESTDELGNDLAGVMTLQRRLSTMERDLAAIQAKVSLGYHSC